MRRIALLAAFVGLVAPATAAASPATVALTACQPRERAAEFEARMDQIPGAERMKLRFTLEMRRVGRAWKKVVSPELGGWRTADAETTRYISSRRVSALVGPASYRTVVRFRWLDGDGVRVASAKATSPVCRQSDLRPNLKPLGVEARPGADASHARYLVPVLNRGRSLAGPFDVVVSVDGTALTPAQAPELGPGERALVEVQGPPCQDGQILTVDVDPTGTVDERAEGDNQLSALCPGAPS
jgi:hypothetical protein